MQRDLPWVHRRHRGSREMLRSQRSRGCPRSGVYPGDPGEGAPPSPVPRPSTASAEPSQEMPAGPHSGPIAERWVFRVLGAPCLGLPLGNGREQPAKPVAARGRIFWFAVRTFSPPQSLGISGAPVLDFPGGSELPSWFRW